MVVISMADCPVSLRGDLTKWLFEINTGVFVGKVSARVREELWERIRDNIRTGKATMVYNTNNEQGMDFKIHNTDWEPIDFDGLKLIMHPSPARTKKLGELRMGYSLASRNRKAKQVSRRQRTAVGYPREYVVVDVETTGLSPVSDQIIEIGALRVSVDGSREAFQAFVIADRVLPKVIKDLTGITDEMLIEDGRALAEVMKDFLEFCGELPMVSHNAGFDGKFLREACRKCGIPVFSNRSIDTLKLSRRYIDSVADYKLGTLLAHLGIEQDTAHRSGEDCMATMQLYEKLLEKITQNTAG
jgi:CRISPR-associated protein Cas2